MIDITQLPGFAEFTQSLGQALRVDDYGMDRWYSVEFWIKPNGAGAEVEGVLIV